MVVLWLKYEIQGPLYTEKIQSFLVLCINEKGRNQSNQLWERSFNATYNNVLSLCEDKP